jgi:hypothetical protein
MSITFTHIFTKPSKEAVFIRDTPQWQGIMSNVHIEFDNLVAQGEVIRTKSLSDDGLTWTFVNTFKDMGALSKFTTAQSLWYDNEFFKFGRGQTSFTTTSTLTIPFTEKVEFTFPNENDPLIEYLVTILKNHSRLTSISNTDNLVTALYSFSDGVDYDQSKSIYNSMVHQTLISKLVANGVVRTRTYAFVNDV